MSPSIPPDQRAALIGPIKDRCGTCGADVVRQYCRTCDEFFYTCSCNADARPHDEHRLYLWTPGGVLAVPDFDNFPS